MTEVRSKVLTCPMYAALPQNVQIQAFKHTPTGTRKCILATNIAETSITIPGVRYVIDTGKHKEKRHINGGEILRSFQSDGPLNIAVQALIPFARRIFQNLPRCSAQVERGEKYVLINLERGGSL